jgi:hypothetical protein
VTVQPAAGDPFARGAPFGRFLLVESIGTGSLFEAHRAKSFGVLGFEKDVALKLLRVEVERDADARARLVDAARRSTALCHANILSVLDLGVAQLGHEDRTFLVTELARGVALDRAVARLRSDGASVPAGSILALCADVAKALDHAHRRKGPGGAVVHGALTTRQVFVTPEGEVKVGDFAVGSPAPATGRAPLQPADDLVALGRMLRELSDVVGAGRDEVLRVAEAFAMGGVLDAGLAHEILIENAYRVGPDAHERDPARLAGTEAGAVPPSIAVHELVREPASAVPGRELPLVLVGQGERSGVSLDALKEDATRAGGLVLLESPSLVVAFGLVDPDGRDTDLAFVFAQAAAARAPASTLLVTTGVLERAADGAMRLVLASRSDLLEIASTRARAPTIPRVAASSRASLAARGAFSFEVDPEQPELSWLIASKGPTRTATRFVGRSDELRRLAEAVQGASRGGPRLLRLVGPVGSGKTRLVLELERRSGGRLTLKLVRCPRHAQPFDALGAAIRELVGAESPEQVEPKLGALALGAADEHVLGALGGGKASASRAAFAAVHAAFAELVRRVAQGRPLVCAFDDAEHIDASSLAVVRDVAGDPDARTLILLLERREPASDSEDRSQTLFVPPLDDDALAALVATRLGARLIPPEVLELFATRTGGVPLVALELVRELVEHALIEVKNGTVVVDRRAAEVVPTGAAELVRARVAALPDEHRRVLAATETLGRGSEADIASAAGLSIEAGQRALDALDLAGLVVEGAGGIGPVGGAGEVALASLAHGGALALSKHAATVLASRGDRLAAAASRLRAGDPAGAAEATLEALRGGGDDAPRAALLLALRLSDLERPADVVDALGLLATATRDGAAGIDVSDVLPRALARVDEALDPAARARARRAAAVVASSALDAELAHVLLDQADALDPAIGEAVPRRLEVACRLLEPELAANLIADAVRAGFADLPAGALLDLAELAALVGDLDAARAAIEAAKPVALAAAEVARTARLDATVRAQSEGADLGPALAALSAAVKLARDADDLREVGRAELSIARTALAAGDVARARGAFDEAALAARSSGDELVSDLARAALAALGATSAEARAASLAERAKTASASGRSALARAIGELAQLVERALLP